jgi:cell division protein FtsB|tara:strand:- start:286 stop:576 length:291 start_codon:yes stop_codon:yes gene_type:complete
MMNRKEIASIAKKVLKRLFFVSLIGSALFSIYWGYSDISNRFDAIERVIEVQVMEFHNLNSEISNLKDEVERLKEEQEDSKQNCDCDSCGEYYENY